MFGNNIFSFHKIFIFRQKGRFFRTKNAVNCTRNLAGRKSRGKEEDKNLTNGNIGDFGVRLKEAMSERGLTGRELAAKAGTTEATVSRYAGGERRPDGFAVLAGLARALNVSSDYLLGLTNNPFAKGSLPAEVKNLLAGWLRADEGDRAVIRAVLAKYGVQV